MSSWRRASKFRKFGIITTGILLAFLISVTLIAVFVPAPQETPLTVASAPAPTNAPNFLPTPLPTVPAFFLDGVQLIDDLIACDTPGAWDKGVMLGVLARQEQEYVDLLKMQLSNCRYAQSATLTPSPTRTNEEIATAICDDFGHILKRLEELGLSSEEKMDYLLADGFTQDDLQDLSMLCNSVQGNQQ